MAMERLSSKLGLRNGHLFHWCPACERMHNFPVNTGNKKDWLVSGTTLIPTINPSIRLSTIVNGIEITECHYIIEKGLLNYCNDTTHKYTNQVIPLPDIPEEFWKKL